MARQGLPKKYAKMGFKKGWRAYKAAKRSPSRSRKQASRSPKPKRRTRKSPLNPRAMVNPRRRAPRTMRGFMTNTTKALISVGTGAVGAVASAGVVNTLPVQTAQGRALTQTGIGIGAMVLSPRRLWWMRVAGAGAALNGAVSLLKASGVPLPYLSGTDQMILSPRYRRTSLSGISPKRLQVKPAATKYRMGKGGIGRGYATMGLNKDFGMGVNFDRPKTGIGGQFVHSAFDA